MNKSAKLTSAGFEPELSDFHEVLALSDLDYLENLRKDSSVMRLWSIPIFLAAAFMATYVVDIFLQAPVELTFNNFQIVAGFVACFALGWSLWFRPAWGVGVGLCAAGFIVVLGLGQIVQGEAAGLAALLTGFQTGWTIHSVKVLFGPNKVSHRALTNAVKVLKKS